MWQLTVIATSVVLWMVWEDPCSVQHETAEKKSWFKISGECFCHNNGIRRRTGNWWQLWGPCYCFGRDNSVQAESRGHTVQRKTPPHPTPCQRQRSSDLPPFEEKHLRLQIAQIKNNNLDEDSNYLSISSVIPNRFSVWKNKHLFQPFSASTV